MNASDSLSTIELKSIARLSNNISVAASQLMQMDQPNIWHQACANLRDFQKTNSSLLDLLDNAANKLGEQQISPLIDSLDKQSNDAAGILSVIRRCLNTTAFLAHVMAHTEIITPTTTTERDPGKRGSIH